MKLLITISFCISLVAGFDYTVVAPKAFRIGAVENVVLNLHGYQQATVSGYLQDLPDQQGVFSPILEMTFQGDAINRPIILPFRVGSEDILNFRNRQHVLMVIQVTNSNGGDFISETNVLVSKEAGYLFIRTNRPIYRPEETVFIQVAPLNQMMAPDNNTIVTVTIKTPDGIGVFKRNSRLPANNFLELKFEVPDIPEIGTWFAEASYSANGFETKAESQFRIDRYVLPTFNVRVELNQPFILPSDHGIFGRIRATFSYGEPVDGSYFLRMRLRRTPESVPVPFFQTPGRFFVTNPILDGVAEFEVPIQDLTDHLDEDETLETLVSNKATIIVEAVVNANAQGTPLEATTTPELPFLASPFVIDTSRTSLFFTPGLVYGIRVDIRSAVTNRPLSDISVAITVAGGGRNQLIEDSTNERGEVNSQIDIDGNQPRIVTITTADANFPVEAQRTTTFMVLPYISNSGEFLQITSSTQVATVGQSNFFLTFSFSTYTPEIRYNVVARGSLVASGTNRPNAESSQSTQPLVITQDMVPNARVVAYYLVNGEVVSNSFWFDVINQCKTDLTVTVPEEVLPGSTIEFNIVGEPNALVGVSAVDRAAYFLFNETRIVKDTMFDAMDDYDQGCVRNGGSDTRSVYINAGLVISSPDISPSLVNDLNCPNSARKKREAEENEAKIRKKRQDEPTGPAEQSRMEQVLALCSRDARLPSPLNETCLERARRVRERFEDRYPGCWRNFRDACFEAERERLQASLLVNTGRTSGDLAAEEIALAQPRIDFRDSLIFTTMSLDSQGQRTFSAPATDSVTTYEVDTISMANTPNGFCVSDTENIRLFKDIFVQIYLPFSIKIREQAVIRMALFNYNPNSEEHTITIRVQTGEALCSKYQGDITSDTAILVEDVVIRGQSELGFSIAVFPIFIPNGGYSRITVQATESRQGGGYRVLDEIQRELLIEESGVLKETYGSYALDVSAGNPQEVVINFGFPEHYIPGTRQCSIYAYTNFLGPTIEVNPETGEPRDVDDVFRMPRGCGEQNMIRCGPNIYAHMYLEETDQLTDAVQPDYDASIARMEECYRIQLKWRSREVNLRAFAVWDRSPPNLWLNAYVLKVFSRAKNYYTDLDVGPVCSALDWIIGEQDITGYFNERYRTHHREMKGAVQGRRTLAAYTLISLEESAHICPGMAAKIAASTTSVMQYLVGEKDHATFVQRPYSLALLAYGLALDSPNGANTHEINDRLLALARTTPDNREVYWTVRDAGVIEGTDLNPFWFDRGNFQAIDVEATAYALLAQIQIAKHNTVTQDVLDFTRKIVHWLIGQRNDAGAFKSTQDTVIGLQALATYEIWISEFDFRQIPIAMDVVITGGPMSEWKQGSEVTFDLTESNAHFKYEQVVPSSVINGLGVTVGISGHGEGVLSYRCTYKTLVDESGCHFVMAPRVILKHSNANDPESLNVYTLDVEIAKIEGSQAEQSIVEIGLLTGFVPDERSIAAITIADRVDGIAQRYDITEQNVVLYFDEITEAGIRFAIDMVQTLEQVLPQPAEIRVLDYYEPNVQCSAFYGLPDALPFLRTTNCEDDDTGICSCAEGGCATCRSRDAQLDNTICLNGTANCAICEGGNCENMFDTACRRNYVYIVTVQAIVSDDGIFIFFTAVVTDILKFGDDASIQKDQTETFMVRRDCFSSCHDPILNEDEDYIREERQLVVMGNKIDVSLDRNGGEIHMYDLDAAAVLERYIPETTCERRRISFANNNCHDLSGAGQSRVDRCNRFQKFITACDNFNLLKIRLQDGCD